MEKPDDKTAGWKPDPDGSGRLRYWNGSFWTQRYAEPTEIATSTPVEPSPAAPESVETSEAAERQGNPWKLVAISAISFAILLAAATAIVVIASQPPDEKIGTVGAPGFDPELAGGGLSSSQIGTDVLLGSVRSSASTGFQILQDGSEENVIDDFKQIQPSAGWDTEFDINGSDLSLRFRNRKSFILRWDRGRSDKTADDLFTIASRYGFLDSDSGAEFAELDKRTADLIVALTSSPLTIGVPMSDLASEAGDLASDWDTWISENPESNQKPYAESSRDLAVIAEGLAASPSDSAISEFNAALDRLEAAGRFNESQ